MRREVVIVGAGVIGLSCAWRLAGRGVDVLVVDPAPGSGATWTAAGMLAPVTEFSYGERALLSLNLAAAHAYPEFVAELEAAAGRAVGYERRGTLQVAWDAADLAALHDLHRQHVALGLPAELITGRDLRRREPALASGLPGALAAPDDHQVDNRALFGALAAVTVAEGTDSLRNRVDRVTTDPLGVVLADGRAVTADHVVVAAGADTRRLAGLPPELAAAVRAVKGQTLRLRSSDGAGLLTHVVRGAVKGSPVYVVPRATGELVIGASSEDAGFDVRPRAGAVYELLRDAFALVPALTECTWDEVSTGLRPGTPDNAPLIGPTSVPGLIMATGHYRNGLLLAPVTAAAVTDLVVDGITPELVRPFAPGRFAAVPA